MAKKKLTKEEIEKRINNNLLYRRCLNCGHFAEINLNQFYIHHKNSKTTYPEYRNICGVNCSDKRGKCICGCDNPSVKLDRRLLDLIGKKLNNGNNGIPPKPKDLGILPNFI